MPTTCPDCAHPKPFYTENVRKGQQWMSKCDRCRARDCEFQRRSAFFRGDLVDVDDRRHSAFNLVRYDAPTHLRDDRANEFRFGLTLKGGDILPKYITRVIAWMRINASSYAIGVERDDKEQHLLLGVLIEGQLSRSTPNLMRVSLSFSEPSPSELLAHRLKDQLALRRALELAYSAAATLERDGRHYATTADDENSKRDDSDAATRRRSPDDERAPRNRRTDAERGP